MSSSHQSEPWFDQWWPLFVIIYGVIFVWIVSHFAPTT